MPTAEDTERPAPCRVTVRLETIMRIAYRGCLSLMALCAIVQCRAQASAPVGPEVAAALAGIVHFTRWPDGRSALRVCAADGDARTADELTHAFAQVAGDDRTVAVMSRPLFGVPVDSMFDCQAIYFGAVASGIYRPLLVGLAGRPILTIGSGDDFCSFGGLFCIDSSNAGARIKANLDSIAGSGLHVNPQLLRLTQRKSKESR